jgi:hypothetical protein
MSLDVHLEIDTGGESMAAVAGIGDITYNVGPMVREALGCGLRDLHGENAAAVLPQLRKAVADMQDRPGVYRALNPENGWGNADWIRNTAITLAFLERFAAECARHPKATVVIS